MGMKHLPGDSRHVRLLLTLVLLMVGAPAVTTRLSAQEAPSQSEISESQRRLEQIRRERAELRDEMDRITVRVRDISTELRNIEQQVASSANALNELDFQLDAQQQMMTRNARELLATQDRLTERRAILHRRLRDIYKRGPLHSTEVLLSARSFSDLINRYRYLFVVARRDRALIEEVQQLENQLVSRERGLRNDLRELNRLLEEKASEHRQLATLEQQQRTTLTSTRARERSTSERIEQLARDERRLADAIAELERRRIEAERLAAERRRAAPADAAAEPATRATSGAGLSTADLGSFAWPVNGRVLYRFGRVTQPNGTILRFNGIGIGAAAGAAVSAIEAGTVVMAGPFEGYGPTVVLSHGGGYYSLYLYLKEIAVREGHEVTRGQRVGTVGGEGTPEGAHIEFQIRAPGGEAVDPLVWLRERGS